MFHSFALILWGSMMKCINSAILADRYFLQSLFQFLTAWWLSELYADRGEEPHLLHTFAGYQPGEPVGQAHL